MPAQAFAGVFAFLAPTMGPAAAGPAAAAQASVSAAAIFDVGTDYVVRGGLALIHPGETIIPPARGSGPFTGASLGAQVHAPVSINVSALDSQSVTRFFNDNSQHMLRAINDAVKRGAHLGLRGAHLARMIALSAEASMGSYISTSRRQSAAVDRRVHLRHDSRISASASPNRA